MISRNYFFATVVFILMYLLFQNFMLIRNNAKNKRLSAETMMIQNLDYDQKEKTPVDCINQTYHCARDYDCVDICGNGGGGTQFGCDGTLRVCRPLETQLRHTEAASTTTPRKRCNKAHGFLQVLSADEVNGVQWNCINALSNVFDNNDNMHNYVCNGGSFEVDLVKENSVAPPPARDCTCKTVENGGGEEMVLAMRLNDFDTPRCVPLKSMPFLPSFMF